MANLDAFVRIELINNDSVLALGTNLMFENAKTLFLSCQPGCVIVKRIKRQAAPAAVMPVPDASSTLSPVA
jgi:hypothetical protein